MNLFGICDTREQAEAIAKRFPSGPPGLDLRGIEVFWFILPLEIGVALAWSFEKWEAVQ
jgi:hypothetical protein